MRSARTGLWDFEGAQLSGGTPRWVVPRMLAGATLCWFPELLKLGGLGF